MPKTSIEFRHFNDKELRQYILEQVDCVDFQNHCNEVALNLGVAVHVVRETLLDYAFQTLKVLQDRQPKHIRTRINITGFFSLETVKTPESFKAIRLIKKQ